MWRGGGLVVIAVAIAACTPAPMFSDAEIESLLADLTQRLEANAHRTCPAPVVRTPVTPGSSTLELTVLFAGAGPLAECLTQLRTLHTGTVAERVAENPPALVAFDADCGDRIAAKLADLASYADACSPQPAGIVAADDELARQLDLAWFVPYHAHQLAAQGHRIEAVQSVLDALRVFEDRTRGRTNVAATMLYTAAIERLAAALDGLLVTTHLEAGDLAHVAAALDALLAGSPRLADVLAGERLWHEINDGATPLMPLGWMPAGDAGHERVVRRGGYYGHPREEAALVLASSAARARDLARICPDTANLATCTRAIAAYEGPGSAAHDDERRALFLDLEVFPDLARGLRHALVEIGRASWRGTDRYAARLAVTVARLAELRLHVETLATGACPPPVTPIPLLGDALEVTPHGNTLEVRPPAWTERSPGPPRPRWTFACAR